MGAFAFTLTSCLQAIALPILKQKKQVAKKKLLRSSRLRWNTWLCKAQKETKVEYKNGGEGRNTKLG